MLKIRNLEVVYKVLSCIFVVFMVVCMLINRNVVDLIYLGFISIFILKYFIEIRRN